MLHQIHSYLNEEHIISHLSVLILLQEKLVTLTSEKSTLDAEAQEAKAAQRRTEIEKLQLQMVNDNLANNNKWLEDNLSQMTGLMKAERQKTTHEVILLSLNLHASNPIKAFWASSDSSMQGKPSLLCFITTHFQLPKRERHCSYLLWTSLGQGAG